MARGAASKAARASRVADAQAKALTLDGFTNFAAKVGIGTGNQSSGAGYSYYNITRNRGTLETAYRTSWLVGRAVDAPAEDMTRAGIQINTTLDPTDVDKIQRRMLAMGVWRELTNALRWARLYGGGAAIVLIEGQDMSTPLRPETVGKGQFKGLLAVDRWLLDPSLGDLVTELGPDLGKPKFYTLTKDAGALNNQKVHHSRIFRFEGLELPYFQKLSENLWGESVIERIYDRLVAFDSTTLGAAQLVYKAHLRTLSVDKLRELIAAGGPVLAGLVKQTEMMRQYQSNEGITLLDSRDKFETHHYTFSGLSDVLMQFAEQVSGALEIPLVRLFGQSPAGFSTGDADLRTYYDGIGRQQERDLSIPMDTILRMLCRSELGMEPPDSFSYVFNSLWQTSDKEKAEIANTLTSAILSAGEVVPPAVILKELRQQSRTTGLWTNITDKDIEDAEGTPPPGEVDLPTDEPGSPDWGKRLEALKVRRTGGREESKLGDDPAQAAEAAEAAEELCQGAKRLSTQDAAASGIDPMTRTITRHGLELLIENARGETRRGGDGWGQWQVVMPAHYGYVVGTGSAEGPDEGMDVFVGPYWANYGHECEVFVIDQADPKTGEFDEHKVMLGFRDWSSAELAYRVAYHDLGRGRVMGVQHMTLEDFKVWVKDSVAVTKPAFSPEGAAA
jgi:phage-related protein (TIGR01555 family)